MGYVFIWGIYLLKNDNIILDKSMDFAVRIVRLYQYLGGDKCEYVLSKQVLKSGTSIGANIKEAIRGQSRADFRSKMNIALKEASETEYWLELLYKTEYISEKQFCSINEDCIELIRILTSIIKNTKEG